VNVVEAFIGNAVQILVGLAFVVWLCLAFEKYGNPTPETPPSDYSTGLTIVKLPSGKLAKVSNGGLRHHLILLLLSESVETRTKAYHFFVDAGVLTTDDLRHLEGLEPLTAASRAALMKQFKGGESE